ncbi:MAG: zinc ribbon domain-containing protein [Deltaproteobacteria bacterium]|nr:zinc ribbon domain-containing protein [Deltaproteobacteria bacterium]
MPLYEYWCFDCQRTFEATHSMSAAPLQECRLCGSQSVKKLISLPMLNKIKSGSPTGARYEKLSATELVKKEAKPLAAVEKQEGMKEKLQIMYGGKLD